MGRCGFCGAESIVISSTLGACGSCIKKRFSEVWPRIKGFHHSSRRPYGLPAQAPQSPQGIYCDQCVQGCRIDEDQRGYCGLRHVRDGVLKGGRPHEGNLSFYYDPLPTNCVADFVCPAGTGAGYPRYAYSRGPEFGRKNLAVFYHACSFNCLFCQNYHFKEATIGGFRRVSAKELASRVDSATSCICYFGGDPTPQILHALKASKLALAANSIRILRICWETNGSAKPKYLKEMARLSMDSGGCIKVDLKAWDERIHLALCGLTNRSILENFAILANESKKRSCPPFLIASTLLVPGYVDEEEVRAIAAFIARLNPEIPYSLLGFYPHFYLRDLPTTSREHAERCKQAALEAGLVRVHIGNVHLLGHAYS